MTLIFLAILAYILAVVFLKRYRKWLLYYLVATFGFTLIVVFGGRYLGLEKELESIEVFLVQKVSHLLGLNAKPVENSVLEVISSQGISLLRVNIECSALIEMAVLAGLVLFYPAFRIRRRVLTLIFGLIFTFFVNIIRIEIIALMLHFSGMEALFWAHAVVARLFFFLTVIFFYWFLLTKPSLRESAKIVKIRSSQPNS